MSYLCLELLLSCSVLYEAPSISFENLLWLTEINGERERENRSCTSQRSNLLLKVFFILRLLVILHWTIFLLLNCSWVFFPDEKLPKSKQFMKLSAISSLSPFCLSVIALCDINDVCRNSACFYQYNWLSNTKCIIYNIIFSPHVTTTMWVKGTIQPNILL